jgi:hypothetical protein
VAKRYWEPCLSCCSCSSPTRILSQAIFASGEGPTVVVETPDSSAPTHRNHQPTSPKTEAANQTEPQQERYLGFSYWVELIDGDGEHTGVTTDRVFQRGDRI